MRFCQMISFSFLLFSLSVLPVQADPVGQIVTLEGRADILRSGSSGAAPVALGEGVELGDILRTKSESRLSIRFVDGTVMDLGPKSRLGIEEYLFEENGNQRAVSLKLYRGQTGFQVPKMPPGSGNRFEMKTRTAVAGVRGTAGHLYNGPVERVYVREGLVEFTSTLGSVMVQAGRVGEALEGRPPVERPFTPLEQQKIEQGSSPLAAATIRSEAISERRPEADSAPAPLNSVQNQISRVETPLPEPPPLPATDIIPALETTTPVEIGVQFP